MGIDGGEHMDPVHQRVTLHILHLLTNHKVNAALRSVNTRIRIRLQGHRSQRRRPLRPPLRLPGPQNYDRALAPPPFGLGPMLLGLFSHVGRRRRTLTPGALARHVLVHVRGGARAELL